MKGMNRHMSAGFILGTLGMFMLPFSAFAATISASVSASAINSLEQFQVTMTSSGVTSCTWSRLDNGTTWAWQDQPLAGTSYDSGIISGWAGPATYEWQFNCDDNFGGSYFAATSITISGGGGPTPVPAILALPSPLVFPNTDTDSYTELHLTVSNTGDVGSLLSGSVSIVGDPSFTCVSGCTYTDVPRGVGPDVTIRFEPESSGLKTATLVFTGGGGTSVPASGMGILAVNPVPLPVIDVDPAGTLLFYSVELGDYRDKQFIVTNVGPSGTLLTGSVNIPAGMGFYCISGCNYSNIGTTDTHYMTIRFAPTGVAGTRITTADFTGGGGATRFVNGDAYNLSINESLDFGEVILGRSKTLVLTVTNPSNVTSIGIGTILVPPPFSCSGLCTYTLPAGAHQNFTITYTPTTLGDDTGTGSLSGYPASILTFTGKAIKERIRVQER